MGVENSQFEVTVNPFSTSDVFISLEWGHVVDGEFKSKGKVYKHTGLMDKCKRSREGQFGKPSFSETYVFALPDGCRLAIAGKKRTGVGTNKITEEYELLFVPIAER